MKSLLLFICFFIFFCCSESLNNDPRLHSNKAVKVLKEPYYKIKMSYFWLVALSQFSRTYLAEILSVLLRNLSCFLFFCSVCFLAALNFTFFIMIFLGLFYFLLLSFQNCFVKSSNFNSYQYFAFLYDQHESPCSLSNLCFVISSKGISNEILSIILPLK